MKKVMLIFFNLIILSSSFSYAGSLRTYYPKLVAQTDIDFKNLGFSNADTQASPKLQKKLEDRQFYLKQHQIWGLVAAGSMALAVLSGGDGDLPPEHAFISGLAFVSYGAAAYTAYKAPEFDGPKKGNIVWHERLAWIHLPGMILTPVLGYMAAKRIDDREKLKSPEKYHKDIAGVTAVALALSVISVSFEF